MARSFRRGGSARSQRRKFWYDSHSSAPTTISGGVGISERLIVPNSAVDEMAEPTVMRIRGSLYTTLSKDQTSAQGVIMAAGIIACDTDMPSGQMSPFDAAISRDWLWHSHGVLTTRGDSFPTFNSSGTPVGFGTGIVHSGDHFIRDIIDSKARRKLQGKWELRLVVEGVDIAGTPDLVYYASTRVLLME